jgi:hypothetical protein
LFFHIRVPKRTDKNLKPVWFKAEPQILRAIVYRLESHDGKPKPVERIGLFPQFVQGGAYDLDARFQNAVRELLGQGPPLLQDPQASKDKGKGKEREVN